MVASLPNLSLLECKGKDEKLVDSATSIPKNA